MHMKAGMGMECPASGPHAATCNKLVKMMMQQQHLANAASHHGGMFGQHHKQAGMYEKTTDYMSSMAHGIMYKAYAMTLAVYTFMINHPQLTFAVIFIASVLMIAAFMVIRRLKWKEYGMKARNFAHRLWAKAHEMMQKYRNRSHAQGNADYQFSWQLTMKGHVDGKKSSGAKPEHGHYGHGPSIHHQLPQHPMTPGDVHHEAVGHLLALVAEAGSSGADTMDARRAAAILLGKSD